MECVEKFYIHYDTQEHCITSEQFILTVKSMQTVSKSLFSVLSNENEKINILVFPPEAGSFLTIFGISSISIGTILQIIESDVGKAFIKGLTGNKPEYYAENAGLFFRDIIKGFYTKSKQEIEELISQYKQLDSAVKAKSDLYKMCIYHNNIKGIGYDTTNNFPIRRSDFIYYISDDLIRKENETCKYRELVIKKPVTIEKDLKWSFIDKNTREHFSAQLEDLAFKQAFLSGFTPIKESQNPDIILAKVKSIKTIINGYKEVNEHFVEDVYKFNNKILKSLPDNFDVDKEIVENTGQLNMFQ